MGVSKSSGAADNDAEGGCVVGAVVCCALITGAWGVWEVEALVARACARCSRRLAKIAARLLTYGVRSSAGNRRGGSWRLRLSGCGCGTGAVLLWQREFV